MSHVASLELCKELYELSDWEDTRDDWYKQDGYGADLVPSTTSAQFGTHERFELFPAYDLGYLLRKLPDDVRRADDVPYGLTLHKLGDRDFHLNYWWFDDCLYSDLEPVATPEDAATKLAIELFKQGVLTKEVR